MASDLMTSSSDPMGEVPTSLADVRLSVFPKIRYVYQFPGRAGGRCSEDEASWRETEENLKHGKW